MNAPHPANAVFRAIKSAVAPIETLEAEARERFPLWATRGQMLISYCDQSGRYRYEWGNAIISRDEAARRLEGRA